MTAAHVHVGGTAPAGADDCARSPSFCRPQRDGAILPENPAGNFRQTPT
jgi:hypothetical protein